MFVNASLAFSKTRALILARQLLSKGQRMSSYLSMDATAPLTALKFSTRSGSGKETDLCFQLNQKEGASAPWRSQAHAEQSLMSVLVIRRLGLHTAN
jgi:hypothetical protein